MQSNIICKQYLRADLNYLRAILIHNDATHIIVKKKNRKIIKGDSQSSAICFTIMIALKKICFPFFDILMAVCLSC